MANIGVTFSEAPQADAIPKFDASGGQQANIMTVLTGLLNSGYLRGGYGTFNANFTIDATKGSANNVTVAFIDNSAGNVTATLPAASLSGGRILVFVVLSSAHNFVIDPNSAETINGAATKTNAVAYSVAIIACDGSNWAGLLSGTWT